MGGRGRNVRERRERQPRSFADWKPKTKLGRLVLKGDVTTFDDALGTGFPVREPEIVDILLPELEDEVLDVACGDGAYAAWFGERVGSRGRVTAIDQSPAWLAVARRRVVIARRCNVELLQADARRLPFADQNASSSSSRDRAATGRPNRASRRDGTAILRRRLGLPEIRGVRRQTAVAVVLRDLR